MADDSLALAKDAFHRGNYAEALQLVLRSSPQTKAERVERDCLVCECLQYKGQFEEALALAESGIKSEPASEVVARYWHVIGRIRLDQLRREDAADALRKGLRAAEKGSDLKVLAMLQQAWLITAGENLGAALTATIREAYHTAVRTADASTLAGFHLQLARLEGQRGEFPQATHHLALAKSLLDRCTHTGLLALYHVNRSCVLGLTGAFEAARKSAETGAALATAAGNGWLAMAAAANVAYIAISTGDLSVAESWLRKAHSEANALGIVEVGVLDSFAHLALLQGDFDQAAHYFAESRKHFEARELRWLTSTEALSLFTELWFHKRRGDRPEYARVLSTIRIASESLNDRHSQVFVALAEGEALFDDRDYEQAQSKICDCLARFPPHIVYRAELSRMVARSLWIQGRQASAKRQLLRASASATLRGTRMSWDDALSEARSIPQVEQCEPAYSLEGQIRKADSKFSMLAKSALPTWYASTPTPEVLPRDPMDGFDDAVGILETSEDPELRGREALASLIALGVTSSAALLVRGDTRTKVVASVGFAAGRLEEFRSSPDCVTLEAGRIEHRVFELVFKPRGDVRSLLAASGLRRLLEAAAALESQKKGQQRLGALWQPEDIVEEPGAVFASPVMIELMLTARKVAATRLPVLLLGPTGTGKEVIANAIHRASPRANKIFLAFNCSAVPRDMVESQLFGYRRGSFTGATDDFAGIIRSAEGGTLFLDEIGELSFDLQPKLLRFLETNEVHPLGEGRPIKVDVRVIAATNANLDDLIERKAFREDLYYRLNIVRFHMPQLAERREEIPALVTHLLRDVQIEQNKHSIKVSDEVMEYLLLYKWPGNIRQLSNEIRRMVAMVESNETLMAEHLTPAIRRSRRTVAASGDTPSGDAETGEPAQGAAEHGPANSMTLPLEQPLPDAVEALERAMIEHAIARAGGKVEEAARLLGISRKGLFLKRRRWLGDDTPSTDV